MILAVMLWLYKLSLHAFPSTFRADFEDEMIGVFQKLLMQQARQSGWALFVVGFREFCQLPLVLWRAHLAAWRKKHAGQAFFQCVTRSPFHSVPPANDGRFCWWQTFLEMMAFVVMAVYLFILGYSRPDWAPVGRQRQWLELGWFILLFVLPILVLGLARGLPRWAYPAAGLLLGYSLLPAQEYRLAYFWAGMLLAAFILALTALYTYLHSQLLPPFLQRIGRSMALDWTRLSFGLYGIMPCLIILAFDGIYRTVRTPYLACSLLLMILGALVYSRSRRQSQQFSVLIASVSVTLLPPLLHQATFQGGLLRWMATPSLWLADVGWISSLWIFMITILLAPMLGRLLYQAWAVNSIVQRDV